MAPALQLALSMPPDPGRVQQVVFITDGAVGNEQELLRLIHDQLGNRRLFTVGIGSAPNSFFMTEAAQFGRGDFTYIGQISEVRKQMEGLFGRLERPALTGLRLDLPVEADILPSPLPDLYSGQPVVALMRLDAVPDRAALEGDLGDIKWQHRLSLQGSSEQSGLGIQWARARIRQWTRAEALGEDPKAVRDRILQLALRHHLVSPHTSLVAVDVTPVRPLDANLKGHALPAHLPAGWEAPIGREDLAQIGMAQGATSYQAWLGIGSILALLALVLLRAEQHRREAV
jgi:Ca-activated chloride channel family protein